MSNTIGNVVKETTKTGNKIVGGLTSDYPLVEKALVSCTSSDSMDTVVEVRRSVKNYNQYNGAIGLRESDIKLTPETFGNCSCSEEKCCPDILNLKWENCDQTHRINGEAGVTMDSYMVCASGGLIVPVTDGQTIENWLSNMVDNLEYEDYLAYLGFPQEYIYYLVDLHERYPNWVFEPVFTGVDFEEFAKFQISNNYKSADNTGNIKYCGTQKYPYEKSNKYRVVDETALRYLMHPGRVLLSDNYVLQFLKADQILPQNYAQIATKQILAGKKNIDVGVVNAIVNSQNSINPVFMATIYRQENGPVGEQYNGANVYNLFNIGANSGREDSKKYAYEKNWFTVEACISGSNELFQGYLNRGQNTLYAMDWHYQGYAQGGAVKQYATLVDDADNKAYNLMYNIPDEILDQNLILSIPIYDNLPQYKKEDLKKYFE